MYKVVVQSRGGRHVYSRKMSSHAVYFMSFEVNDKPFMFSLEQAGFNVYFKMIKC